MDARSDGDGGPVVARILPLLGRADEDRAEVWIRCLLPDQGDAPAGTAPIVVRGTLTGPSCAVANTLPTTVPLVDQGSEAGRPALARALCTEPAFWTPEMPHLYRVEVELLRGGRVVAAGGRSIGMRRAGTRGASLWLEGRRFVPRGVRFDGDGEALAALRGVAATAVIDSEMLRETMLDAADRLGVGVVVRVGDVPHPMTLASLVDTCAAHPSVFVVVLPHQAVSDAARLGAVLARRRGTMLLGASVDARLPPPGLPPGPDLLVAVLPEGGVPHEAWRTPSGMPRVALETVGGDTPPDTLRRACDSLQARLAAWVLAAAPYPPTDWAGYLVV